jgi:hypothetical protein
MCQNWEHRKQRKRVEALLYPGFCLLDSLYQGLQSHQSLEKHLALLLQRDRLLHGCADPEKLPHFIKGPTEARCRWEASKSTHGIVTLFDATVILFQLIVEIMITLMENVLTKDLANCTGVRTVSIRDHSRLQLGQLSGGLAGKNTWQRPYLVSD